MQELCCYSLTGQGSTASLTPAVYIICVIAVCLCAGTEIFTALFNSRAANAWKYLGKGHKERLSKSLVVTWLKSNYLIGKD